MNEDLLINFENLNISKNYYDEKKIIKIQKWFRGNIYRKKRLPLILFVIKKYLETSIIFKFSNKFDDGRTNSCIDEDEITKLLIEKFQNRIYKPKMRSWYDILVKDYNNGWIPINIKTTTTLTCDNTGNLAMCVYGYTDEKLDFYNNKIHENGKMSLLLIEKIKNLSFNKNYKKDYYFLVFNKNNNKDIIINSLRGLSVLSPNSNNLPFQVKWSKNREYEYEQDIKKKVKMFINCLKKTKPCWKEIFMRDIKELNLCVI
jgi:hypothetical protein